MVRTPCCKSEGLKKGAWNEEEDQKLIAYLQLHGEGGWRTLPDKAGLKRCGKSCRLRWANYLRPGIKRGEFSRDEDDSIIKLHAIHGNKWSAIARGLEGRTDNEIKNHWNTRIKKYLIKKGIDPLSHKALFGGVTNASHYLRGKNNVHHEEEDDPNSNNKKLLRTSLSQFLNIVGNKFGKRINYSVLSNIIGSGANRTTNSITSASKCKRSLDFSSTTTSINLLTDQNLTSSTVSKSFSPLMYDNIFGDNEDITEFSTRFLSDVASRKDEDFLMLDDSCLENNFFMLTSPINEVDDSFEGIENYFG